MVDVSRDRLLSENYLLLQVMETCDEAVIVTDLQGAILAWNKACERDFGYQAVEMIGRNTALITVDPSDETGHSAVIKALKEQESVKKIVQRRKKDGSIVWVSLVVHQLTDKSNAPALLMGISKVITQEDERQMRLTVLETLMETVAEGVLITSTQENGKEDILFANNAFQVLTGVNEEDLKKCPSELLEKLFPEWDGQKANTDSILHLEVKLSQDDKPVWFHLTVVPVIVETGKVSHRLYNLRDISLRKQMVDQLHDQNMNLMQAHQEMDQMIYGVTHDLRSPLNSILGLTNLMRKESYGAEAEIFLDKISRSANKLNEFILNVIQYSKNNRKVPLIQKVDFGELFNIAADLHRYTETGQRIAFQYVNTQRISINSDKDRWQTILNNLIGNSIKFSRNIPNAFVKVAVSKNANSVFISIEDNGTGIPKDRLGSIFEMFYRADNIRSGSGLGLFIVKQSVEAIGGTIAVESQVNSMTKFTITLPITVLNHAGESN